MPHSIPIHTFPTSPTKSALNLVVNGKPVTIETPLRTSHLTAAGLPRPYDPGYANTAAFTSRITYIDGSRGLLRHRGYPISSLASKCNFLEVAHLLIFGALPTTTQLSTFQAALFTNPSSKVHGDVQAVIQALPRGGHPMSALMAAFSAISAVSPQYNPAIVGSRVYDKLSVREAVICKVLAHMPAIAAGVYRHSQGLYPLFLDLPHDPGMNFAERFLRLVNGTTPHPKIVQALETLLIIHADHEQNCSTATVRQLTSSGVDAFSAVVGGIAALYGPLHGGASEGVLRMLQRIGDKKNVPAFLERVKRREERLTGFGHRVYKNYDPRATIIRKLLQNVFQVVGKVDPLIEIATTLEQAALKDAYFVDRKLYPNVDFYSGILYKTIGFEAEFYPVLFALGRCAGWMAHWHEFLDDPDRRIARPHQRFVGELGPKDVPHISERDADKVGISPDAAKQGITIAKL